MYETTETSKLYAFMPIKSQGHKSHIEIPHTVRKKHKHSIHRLTSRMLYIIESMVKCFSLEETVVRHQS